MWAIAAFVSALLLGAYDIFRKHALRENAVLPVLFLATFSGTCVAGTILITGTLCPEWLAKIGASIVPLSGREHAAIFLKAVIVSLSWVLGYFAMKHLPISIAGPIRASSPVWTLMGAILLFGERLTAWQWAGLAVLLGSYYAFSLMGRWEGIRFARNWWVYCVVLEALFGSASALYDKYLLQSMHLPVLTMLVWFSTYMSVILSLVLACGWWPVRKRCTPLAWRWSIPCIGVLLVISDCIYYWALSHQEALIALVSAIRRSNVLVSFVVGSILFQEQNKRWKSLALLGVLIGVFMIVLSVRRH